MTTDQWLEWALADAERRRLSSLKPLLEAFARSLRALRDADFNNSPVRLEPNAADPYSPAKAGRHEPRT
jgi:hypothetical protein